MESFDFTLSKSIEVSSDGEFVSVDEITCHSPSVKHKKPTIRLRQKFMHAIKNSSDGKEGKKPRDGDPKKELTGSDIEAMIFMGGGNDEEFAVNFMDTFQNMLLTPGVAYVGKEALRGSDLEKISCEDFERLMGQYIANFFISSWLPIETMKS